MATIIVSIVLRPQSNKMDLEIRNRILVKAEEMFLRFGIRSVTMDDMATELGMSKKTLYQFFADKDDLVLEVVKVYTQRSRQDCDCVRSKAKDAIHENLLTMERVMADLANMNPMILFDLQKFHHKAFHAFLEYKKDYLLVFIRENIQRGIQEKIYRTDINVEIMSRFRLESMLIPFNMMIASPTAYSLQQIVQQVAENFIYGLVSPEGYQLFNSYKNVSNKTS